MAILSGRGSFSGDAYTVRKWTINLRQEFGNAHRRNREMSGAFRKHLYHHQRIQRNTEMLFSNDARFFFHSARVPSVIVCLVCSLRCVETDSRFLSTLYASLPWIFVQLDFYAYHTQKCALTRPLYTAHHTKILHNGLLYMFEQLLHLWSDSQWSRVLALIAVV